MAQERSRPSQSGLDHLGISVADLERSMAFYCDVLGAVVVDEPSAGWRSSFSGRTAVVLLGSLGLDLFEHAGNDGETFDPARTGLDHFAFAADSYEHLEAWGRWLDARGVQRSEIREAGGGVASMFDFVDPDGLQLEFLFMDQAKLSSMLSGRPAGATG
jgi:glyoxylase I family protein